MSREKILHLEGLGVEVIITRSDVAKGHPDHYQDMAQSLAEKTPNSFLANQFDNPANALRTTPPLGQKFGSKRMDKLMPL